MIVWGSTNSPKALMYLTFLSLSCTRYPQLSEPMWSCTPVTSLSQSCFTAQREWGRSHHHQKLTGSRVSEHKEETTSRNRHRSVPKAALSFLWSSLYLCTTGLTTQVSQGPPIRNEYWTCAYIFVCTLPGTIINRGHCPQFSQLSVCKHTSLTQTEHETIYTHSNINWIILG